MDKFVLRIPARSVAATVYGQAKKTTLTIYNLIKMSETDLTENEILSSIAKFKSLKLLSYTNENVLDYLKYFDSQYLQCFSNGVFPLLTQKHILFDSYFRFRKFDEIKDFSCTSTYSYPQKSGCNELRRANLPGYPVFYCSQHPSTAILEMGKWNNNKKRYVVSKWTKQNKNETLLYMPTFPDQNQFHNSLDQIITQWIVDNDSYKKAIKRFVLFVGDELMREDDYSVSACLSYKLLYEKNIDVISYPSSIDYKGINFAFSPTIIDKKILKLDRVYIVDIGDYRQITLFNVGIFNDDNVDWHNANSLSQDCDIITTFKNDFSIN